MTDEKTKTENILPSKEPRKAAVYRLADIDIKIGCRYPYSYKMLEPYKAEKETFDFEVYPSEEDIVAVDPDSAAPAWYKENLAILKIISNKLIDCYNGFLFHCSSLLYEGGGYAFAAKSGTGKSTHSQSWLRNFPGCELMNDDNPIIRITDEGVFVYGSPWSGKTPCYKQLKAPVGALVSLVQAKHNKIRKLDNVKGFVSIFSSVSTLMCHGESYQSILSTMLRLAELVPVYELENLPDDDAAKLCKSTVVCP